METALNIGFIGLGTMGSPMAWNLHEAGFNIGVYNRTADKAEPFESEKLPVYKTPKALAAQSNVIIIMVTDSQALLEVLEADNGVLEGLNPDTTVVNMSTVSREATMNSAREVKRRSGYFIDAPVSGTKKPAEEGTLTILAAGDKKHVENLDEIFKSMGDTVIFCGEVGKGSDMKLTVNLLLGGMMQVFAEALVFGQKQGLSINSIMESISSGPLSAPFYDIKASLIENRDFEKNFPVDLLLKDLDLVLDAAKKNRAYLPAIATVREAVNGTHSLGHGDEDMAAVVKLLENVSKLEDE